MSGADRYRSLSHAYATHAPHATYALKLECENGSVPVSPPLEVHHSSLALE